MGERQGIPNLKTKTEAMAELGIRKELFAEIIKEVEFYQPKRRKYYDVEDIKRALMKSKKLPKCISPLDNSIPKKVNATIPTSRLKASVGLDEAWTLTAKKRQKSSRGSSTIS